MRKKYIAILLIIVQMFLLLHGCDSSDNEKTDDSKFIWGSELVKYDMYVNNGNIIGFNIPFAYIGNKDNLELISITGENTDKAEVEIFDDTILEFENLEYNRYKLGLLGLIISWEPNINIEIREIKVKINGREENIVLKNPVILKHNENSNSIIEYVSSDVVGSGTDIALTYKIASDENIKVTACELIEPFSINSIDTKVSGRTIQEFPFELKTEEEMLVNIESLIDKDNQYCFLGSNFIIHYENSEGNKEKYMFTLVKQGAGNEETGNVVLKKLVDRGK